MSTPRVPPVYDAIVVGLALRPPRRSEHRRARAARHRRGARAFLRRRIPLADGDRRLAKICMHTNSPDTFFTIDRVPNAPIVYASACSGHGFKFASAIGELLADMTTRDASAPSFLE